MNQLADNLKNHGYKITTARQIVFEALRGQEPLSISELLARCSSIDRASVYRTVDLFQQLGIIQRLQTGWKYKLELTDTFHEHHHHATCQRCGKTIPLEEDARIERLIKDLAHNHSFTVTGHQLELQGICSSCQPA